MSVSICFDAKLLMTLFGEAAVTQQDEICYRLSHQNNEDNRKKVIAFCDEYICKTKRILSFGEIARTMLRSRGEPEDSAQKIYDALVELKAIIEKSDNVKEDVEKIVIARGLELMEE